MSPFYRRATQFNSLRGRPTSYPSGVTDPYWIPVLVKRIADLTAVQALELIVALELALGKPTHRLQIPGLLMEYVGSMGLADWRRKHK